MACYICQCGKKICDPTQDQCDNCHQWIPEDAWDEKEEESE